MEEDRNDRLSERQTLHYARKADENEFPRSFTSAPPLVIQSAKFGERFLWYGDKLRQQEMLQPPVATLKDEDWNPSRLILVLTHTDKNFPELGEYLHWVVPLRNDFEIYQEDEIIPYTPPVQGDPPFLYTFTLYAQFKVDLTQPLVGLPCLEGGENNRRNFNSEHFAILNKLEATHTVHFRV